MKRNKILRMVDLLKDHELHRILVLHVIQFHPERERNNGNLIDYWFFNNERTDIIL